LLQIFAYCSIREIGVKFANRFYIIQSTCTTGGNVARSERQPTLNIALDAKLQKPPAEEMARCPYCKKELESALETACPHCGLPIRRRKRQRQITAQGGSLAKIIIHLPGEADKECFLSKPVITLGRHSDNMIQIESPIVSNEHARIEFTSSGHTLTDLGSTNGTRQLHQTDLPGPLRL
jgi:hypothetical protein